MSSTVSTFESRSLDQPDDTRRPPNATVEQVNMGEHSVGRFTFQPGWTWASSVKPTAGTDHCEKTHLGYCVSGHLRVWTTDGREHHMKAGDAYVIPPGHDAEVVGDEPFVGVEFSTSSAQSYAR